jgi:hypothetical protein
MENRKPHSSIILLDTHSHPPTDRLTSSSVQIYASLVFDLSYFYAMVADFHTRVQCLFSKPGYSVLMSSHLSRSRAVRGIRLRIKRHAKQRTGKRASERAKQPETSPLVRMKSDPLAKSMKMLGAGEALRFKTFNPTLAAKSMI